MGKRTRCHLPASDSTIQGYDHSWKVSRICCESPHGDCYEFLENYRWQWINHAGATGFRNWTAAARKHNFADQSRQDVEIFSFHAGELYGKDLYLHPLFQSLEQQSKCPNEIRASQD
jgi:hypothetical protein